MGEWKKQPDTSTHNIPATAGTYNNDPYYIGLLKNGELNTTEAISDLTITKSVEWIKDAYIDPQTKSPNGDYYPLTYEVDENTDKSEREGIISITHNAANKTLKYIIKQSATQEPTEPTLTVYQFIAKYHVDNQGDGDKYSLKVNNYSVGSESGPFESISSDEIKDGVISDEKPFKINITMSNPYDKELQSDSDLIFKFEISCENLESFDATINEDDSGGEKTVYIQHSQSNIGELKIESIRPGLVISITIFKEGQTTITDQLKLSADIAGNITINSDIIPFVVTFGFIN